MHLFLMHIYLQSIRRRVQTLAKLLRLINRRFVIIIVCYTTGAA